MNKKVVIIGISAVILVSIIGLITDGFVGQNSEKNLLIIVNKTQMPSVFVGQNSEKNLLIIVNKTQIPSVPTGHHIEINLNESMHFATH